MTREDEELLAELLLRWDELREQGQDVSSIELCQAFPHLVDELERRIRALRASDWMDSPIELTDTDDNNSSATYEPRTLVGRYRLDDLIAQGGFAQVWRAYDIELHRNVAVKMPKPSRLDSTDAFLAEARRVARLKHPGIVPVHDVGRDNGNVFIVSEFVEGGNLSDYIRQKNVIQEQAVRWTAEIAEALEYAHSNGVIHRDIKPANILIDHHGRALLADFGIAQSATKSGQFAPSIGTLRYMAPEQLEGRDVDARSDVYSLGIVLHELLTGKLPYSSIDPSVLRREIATGVKIDDENLSLELRRICLKATECAPLSRYQSAKLFSNELNNVTPKSRGKIFVLSLLVALFGIVGIANWQFNPKPNLQNDDVKPNLTRVPLDPKWMSGIAEMNADDQLSEVIKKLKELNPNFDGQVSSEQQNGVVHRIEFRSDNVTDIRPLAALKKLQYVDLSGSFTWKHNGQLIDISPLRGLPLEYVDIHSSLVKDVSPLESAPLKVLILNNTAVTDLTPIRNAKLVVLDIHNTFIANLEPIRGMHLTNLHMANTQVKDLSPLTGMPLNDLRCQYCGVSDLSPLQGMPLHSLECHGNPIGDLSPLRDSSVCNLNIYKTPIIDWSPLLTMPRLRMVGMDFVQERDAKILQAITTLEEINKESVEDFWKTVEQPETAVEAVAIGESYMRQHKTEKAIEYFTIAIELDPTFAKAFVERGECLFTEEHYQKALADFKHAVDLEPKNPISWERLANANFHLRNFDDAVSAMEKAIAFKPPEVDRFKKSLATMLSNRAFSYSQEKKYSDAIADLDKALVLDPNSVSFHRLRAGCFFNSGDYERALPDFDEAIRRDPTNGSFYMSRGYCLNALGRNDEADRDFKKAKELSRE